MDLSNPDDKCLSTPLAMKTQVKNFWYLLNAHSKKSIYDDHTWMSVFKVILVGFSNVIEVVAYVYQYM